MLKIIMDRSNWWKIGVLSRKNVEQKFTFKNDA